MPAREFVRCLGVGVLASLLVTLPASSASAKKQHARPTTVNVGGGQTAGVAGKPLTLTGSVSSTGPCARSRAVSVHAVKGGSDSVLGTTTSGSDGGFSLQTAAPGGFFNVYAAASKRKSKKAICKAGTSAQAHFSDQPPVLDLTAPTPAVTGKTGPIAYTVSEPATVVCVLDGSPIDPCDGYSNLTHGNHTLDVTATDSSGGFAFVSVTFFVDAQGPSVVITSPTQDENTGSPVTLTFTATDLSPPVTTTCSVDGDTPAVCTSGGQIALADGPHSITVDATDAFGNVGEATVSFQVS